MKRIGYIYEKIISFENCQQAIINASSGKLNRKSVQQILIHLDEYTLDLQKRLIELTFVTPYREQTITDGLSKKTRTLQIPSFYPDLCAQHAIMLVLSPYITKSSYYWSCSNFPRRGMDHACKCVERATKRDKTHSKYCFKADISKFYPSVNNKILKKRIREVIKDTKALKIVDTVINTHTMGLPIGNYTSPWFAELMLQPMDRIIKQVYKIWHYARYADDIVLIDSNKRKLRKAMQGIIGYLSEKLLCIKKDYQLFRIRKGDKGRNIDFVGKCFSKGFTTVRKRRALAFMRTSRFVQKLQKDGLKIRFRTAMRFESQASCLKRTNSLGLKNKYYDTVNIKELIEVIANEIKRRVIRAERIAKWISEEMQRNRRNFMESSRRATEYE